MENNEKQNIEKALIKKAIGFSHDEIIEEYSVDEGGDVKLVKKKVTKKFSPPDIPAIKLLLDNFDNQIPLAQMTEQQLKQEKNRLLKELEKIKKEKSDDNWKMWKANKMWFLWLS